MSGWCLVVLGCLISQPLAAQGVTKVDSAEYRERIRKALEEYELGNYAEAKLFFSDAHALFPNARTLRGLGLVAYSLRDYVSATDQLAQSLASDVKPLTKDLRASTEQILEQSKRFEARLSLAIEPREAEVRVDGEPPVWDAAGKVRVNPGVHEVTATLARHRSETRRITLDAGAEKRLSIQLHAELAAISDRQSVSPPPIAAKLPAPLEEAPEPRNEHGPGIGPWVLIGASAAVAIGGGVLLGLGLSDVGEVEGAKYMTAWSSVEPAYDRSAPLTGVGITLLAVGGAGILGGLGWQLWGAGPSDDVAVSATPTSVRLRLSL